MSTLPSAKLADISIFLVRLAVPTSAILQRPCLSGAHMFSAEKAQPWKEVKCAMIAAAQYDFRVQDVLSRLKAMEQKLNAQASLCPYLHPLPPDDALEDS